MLIQVRHLIEGCAYLIFPKLWSDMIRFLSNMYMSVPVLQKSQNDPAAQGLLGFR